ncbi:class I SAM-dependent methyltransferase [Paenibacillus hodogayensis]|uniref:Class I SAM-dependent methyltransferase n=1 Tax=Paenibacillus hodogayensis TaxID=279208 RepID=A0ABV5W2E5_9BACL
MADAKTRGGRVLDIGCSDGLLLQQLAPFAQKVVGIDPDSETILSAQTRLAGVSNVSLVTGDFLDMPIPSQKERYSTVICVATLHHI